MNETKKCIVFNNTKGMNHLKNLLFLKVLCSADWNGGGGGGAGIIYRGPAVRKGTRDPTTLHMFLSFSVVSLFVVCTN